MEAEVKTSRLRAGNSLSGVHCRCLTFLFQPQTNYPPKHSLLLTHLPIICDDNIHIHSDALGLSDTCLSVASLKSFQGQVAGVGCVTVSMVTDSHWRNDDLTGAERSDVPSHGRRLVASWELFSTGTCTGGDKPR
ncbi:hypothetical protein JOB18_045753 [Solea senegalensis]|uniref:Uncharacterized protein n=1 Tax=Solea senegalensis TaxID=28829 RepID=A0AAV6QAU9_SOLSE|nr:hypothetical protein JOB18_045753 [Solea senegalensis]